MTKLAIQNIHPEWLKLLNTIVKNDKSVIDVLDETIEKIVNLKQKLCPDSPDKILRCLQLDPSKIKVVILGQDPYPEPNVATGLAFACKKMMPSLEFITNSLSQEYNLELTNFNTELTQWEEQGILLLNSSLSCEQFRPSSHSSIWEEFISQLITLISNHNVLNSDYEKKVFLLLGRSAQMFDLEINKDFNYVIHRTHPAAQKHSGLMFKSFGKEVNSLLKEEIKWI